MSLEVRDVEIVRLGAQGDGVAVVDGAETFVPFSLPGERWRLEPGVAPRRLSDSPDRRPAPCPHFERCGGCTVQHLAPEAYQAWKHAIVVTAFAHRGIETDIAPVRVVAPGSRRRAVLGVARKGGTIALGFREGGSHTLVDLAACVVLDPAIVAAFPALRRLAGLALGPAGSGRLIVTRADHGLDVALETGTGRMLTADARAEAAGIAGAARILRLTIDADPVFLGNPPIVTLGGVAVVPPAGVFLQAVPEAEVAMTELVLAGVGNAKRVADLFCGVGTFSLPLARAARVAAFDGDKAALAALEAALRHAEGLKPVSTRQRDLFREPLSPKELEDLDAVVLDPPRAGAAEQAARLARSSVPVVVAVSCNPATLARDVRVLIDGGYALEGFTPVDQFLYSAHVEAVAVLRRPRRRGARAR